MLPNRSHRMGKGTGDPVFVDGTRSPFVKSFGAFSETDTLELFSRTVQGMLRKVSLDPQEIDEISAGVVIPQPKNPNVARDAALNIGLPDHIHGSTTNRACTSSLHTILDAANKVASGRNEMILAGGVEVLSDVPIVYSKAARSFLLKFSKAKSTASRIMLLKDFSASAWLPKAPSISEPLTGKTMGQHAELMAKIYEIPRAEQDQFAVESHQKAAAALQSGVLAEEITPIWSGPRFSKCIKQDDVIRPDTSLEKIAKLRTVFDRKRGSITAATSSPLTDGAAIGLVCDKQLAIDLGLKPKLKIVDSVWVGVRPYEELLIGPALVVPQLLKRNRLGVKDVDRFEIHEAFAAQVLCCLKAMKMDSFLQKHFGDTTLKTEIPREKLNVNGGAIAIGHPFGATGARLCLSMANELHRSDKQFGIIAICAAGGMSGGMLVERIA